MSHHSLTQNIRAAGLFVLGSGAFVLNDAVVKLMAGEIGLFQAMALRGTIGCALMAALIWPTLRRHRLRLPPGDRLPLAIRTAGDLITTILFTNAIFRMPIANASAVLQTAPLVITLAAAVFLGERVGWRRGGAICLGFLGMLMVVQPGTEGFNLWSVTVFGAVIGLAMRDIATRKMSAALPSGYIALVSTAGVTAGCWIGAGFGTWLPLGAAHAGLLTLAAALVMAGYLLSTMALRVGDFGFIGPFRYSSLVWSMIFGLIFFGNFPGPLALAGIALIIGTGVFTFFRERALARKGAA